MNNNPKARKRKRTRRIAIFLLCICLLAAIYLGLQGGAELLERHQGNNYYSQLAASQGEANRGVAGATSSSIDSSPGKTVSAGMATSTSTLQGTAQATEIDTPRAPQSEMDFESLREISPDIVGWIRCEDTVIDYPIMQGRDNSYYLNHLPDGTKNAAGSILMDSACDPLFGDDMTILHGHHMKNGSMFGDLHQYSDMAYYEEHPTMRLYTPDGDYDVEVFAAIIVNGKQFAYSTAYADEAHFQQFKQSALDASAINTGVDIQCTDRLLLLSTCDYTYQFARFLLIGKIVTDEP